MGTLKSWLHCSLAYAISRPFAGNLCCSTKQKGKYIFWGSWDQVRWSDRRILFGSWEVPKKLVYGSMTACRTDAYIFNDFLQASIWRDHPSYWHLLKITRISLRGSPLFWTLFAFCFSLLSFSVALSCILTRLLCGKHWESKRELLARVIWRD